MPGAMLPVYWVKKGSKQGCPLGPLYFGYGGALMLRTLKAELSQHPSNYCTLSIDRPPAAGSDVSTFELPPIPTSKTAARPTSAVKAKACAPPAESSGNLEESPPLHSSILLSAPQIGAYMDDTLSQAPPLTTSLVYHWLWQNGPHFGYWLNKKKTITLVPGIDGMEKAATAVRSGHAPGIQSAIPRYQEVRATLHTLGSSAPHYAHYSKQRANIRGQAARPSMTGGHWRVLPEGILPHAKRSGQSLPGEQMRPGHLSLCHLQRMATEVQGRMLMQHPTSPCLPQCPLCRDR